MFQGLISCPAAPQCSALLPFDVVCEVLSTEELQRVNGVMQTVPTAALQPKIAQRTVTLDDLSLAFDDSGVLRHKTASTSLL